MKADALRGHLDPMILAVVEHEPLHGYAIMEALQERSGGAVDLPTGTLYPALRRLERAGYLASEWSTVSGRKRRTYQLTSAGQKMLADGRGEWETFRTVIEGVLRPRTS
ncbi:PadR family transcriptional regulator [Kribbella sp. ALI-6-A]|jgi:DNA-binding PadR family transcriptional regulator|uniref:PadR family transcriptional regulator n=1 Tax=Kribbella sp. ALI-6-A TaxID=1933817 RepID=UPI00097BD05A|nr:helix-turn-helix transcriptional regulator [Kribbella sp. ALI-6-A]ONI67818.1 PadR family transcriptional regulator [Kribbella sp. ALI-6-A]